MRGSIRPTGPVDPTKWNASAVAVHCSAFRIAESYGRRRTHDLLTNMRVDDGRPLSGAQKLRNEEAAIGALAGIPAAEHENSARGCWKMVTAVCRHGSGACSRLMPHSSLRAAAYQAGMPGH
jgi:hypothetical protein